MGGAPFYKILSKKRLQCRREARPQIKPALLPLPTFCPQNPPSSCENSRSALPFQIAIPDSSAFIGLFPRPFSSLQDFTRAQGRDCGSSPFSCIRHCAAHAPRKPIRSVFFGKPHLRKCRPGGTIRHSQQPAGPVASSRLPCIFRTTPGLARNGSEALPPPPFFISSPFFKYPDSVIATSRPASPPGCAQADKKRAGHMSGPKIIRLSASC